LPHGVRWGLLRQDGAIRLLPGAAAVDHRQPAGDLFMRSILLILLGVPLPVILLLAFCTHHF
jgi:hypothetical protein